MTPAAVLLLLAFGAAAPAAGAAAAAPPSFDPDALEKDWWRRSDLEEAELAQMRAIRLAFPGADPEAAIARWDELSRRYGAYTKLEQDQRGALDRYLRNQLFVDMVGGINKAKDGRERDLGREADSARRVDAKDKMRSRAVRVSTTFNEEVDTFRPTRDAYLAERKERRRLLLQGACAALLLLGAGYAYSRAGLPPPPPSPAQPQPFPFTVAGNFTVVRALGRGSLGEVYEALDKTLNRRTALKRLRAELISDPRELERLLAEARVMAALKHPNMVAIHGVERDAGQVYLALEFVDGGSLDARLGREGRLGWGEALRVLAGAAAAVDYCHGHKVIHRDLKPGNIMLSSAGEAKVTDFSIAYQAAQSVSRLTRQPSWGTPPYMAPEQELGELSGSVDVYALGVCFYEMLTGELPFVGPNFLAQKREQAWAPPRRLVPDLPRGTDDLFAVALAPEPARRFKSAGALAGAARALTA